jgi:bacterial/archaeal transporter family-2 protein
MEKLILGALLVALGSGLAIGLQNTLVSRASPFVGAVHTGLLVNLAGGTLSLLLLAFFTLRNPAFPWEGVRESALFWAAAGVLGMGVVMGISFALPRTGIAAGLAAIILGQLFVAVVADTFGWGGSRIPLSLSRVLGITLLVAATWLLMPRAEAT